MGSPNIHHFILKNYLFKITPFFNKIQSFFDLFKIKKNTIAGQWCFRNVGKDKECEHKIGSNLLYVQLDKASIKSRD